MPDMSTSIFVFSDNACYEIQVRPCQVPSVVAVKNMAPDAGLLKTADYLTARELKVNEITEITCLEP
jgi:hypothetical protein